MLQLILTIIIVTSAFGISIYRVVRYFRNPLRGCDGCEKSCGGCPLEELKTKKNQLK